MQRKARLVYLFGILIIYFVFLLIDFLLTPNPYAAIHAGRGGAGAAILSTSFRVNPYYFILLLLISFYILAKGIAFTPAMFVSGVIVFFSAIVSGTESSQFQTYFVDFFSFIGLSSVSYYIYSGAQENEKVDVKKTYYVILFITILGLSLAILRPNYYGRITFEFSRSSRGEVTLWMLMSIPSIFSCLSIVAYDRFKKKWMIVFALGLWFIIAASSYRLYTIVSIIPILVYFINNRKSKLIVIASMLLLLLLFGRFIISFFTIDVTNFFSEQSINTILNGRFELWRYYLTKFMEKPFLGNGAQILGRANDYRALSTSEVGFLKWFAHYGIFFGSLMLAIIINSFITAIKTISNKDNARWFDLLLSFIVISMSIALIEGFDRIINFQDLTFWFSVMYVNWTSGNRFFSKPICLRLNKSARRISL